MKKGKKDLKDLTMSTYTHTQMRGYSFMWPYVAFSGVESNTLMVVNAFQRDYVNLVEITRSKRNMYIIKTIISETNDLFVFIKAEKWYQVYLIDLDASNIKELEGDTEKIREEKMKLIFKPELIL